MSVPNKNPENDGSDRSMDYQSLLDEMWQSYATKLLPLEEASRFHEFHNPRLEEADFHDKPMIMVVGQYSTGKTTFIRYMLDGNFPGIRIGPEPTTDSFTIVTHGMQEQIILGDTLAVDGSKRYRPLAKFGNALLNKLHCASVDNEVLKFINIIDTPGVLAGEKEQFDRGYSMNSVINWFADKADCIILLFDAHKLDISNELKSLIEKLAPYGDKVRIVLNKADTINAQELMRVYGALMWSLSKLVKSPEVTRIYIGSFWNQPTDDRLRASLFEPEARDLFTDLQKLPGNCANRKLNDLIRRAKVVRNHALIISGIRKMKRIITSKRSVIRSLPRLYEQIAKKHDITIRDLPDMAFMQSQLETFEWNKFGRIKSQHIRDLDSFIDVDSGSLRKKLIELELLEQKYKGAMFGINGDSRVLVRGGVFKRFGLQQSLQSHIEVTSDPDIMRIVRDFNPSEKIIKCNEFHQQMSEKFNVPPKEMTQIWRLADIDGNGELDLEEFAIAVILLKLRASGNEIPNRLPISIIPSSKRAYV